MKERLLYKSTRKLPEIFTEDDLQKILKQVYLSKDYWRTDYGEFMRWRDICIVATIYLLGLRPKEACKLRFDDFNLKASIVKIRGKNNKLRKDRTIPVPKSLLNFYKIYLKFPRARFWRGSKFLFPSHQNPSISTNRWKHIFREKILKPCGLWMMPETGKVSKFRSYTLRHSRASHILKKQIKEKGIADLFMIANFLGHGDIRSSQVYLHTDTDYLSYMKGWLE